MSTPVAVPETAPPRAPSERAPSLPGQVEVAASRAPSFPGARAKDSAELDRAFDDEGRLDDSRFAEVERALVEAGRWIELAELYALAAARARDPELGRSMLLSAGLLWLEKLGDPQQAEPFLRRILASDPEHVDALDACRSIAEQAGRFDEAADLLDRIIEVVDDDEKPDLLIALARIAHQELKQVDRAVAALHAAFEVAPEAAKGAEILGEARRIFEAEERWAEAKQVLDDQAGTIAAIAPPADGAGAPGDAAAAGELDPAWADRTRAIAEGYRQLGVRLLDQAIFHPLAEACLDRARSLGDADALSKLDELAHIRTTWEARAKALREEALEARDKRRAAQLYLRAAELYSVYGKDPIRADEHLERCLLLVPGYPPALAFLEATHLAAPGTARAGRPQGAEDAAAEVGRTEDLIRRFNAMAAAVKDPAVKVEILVRGAGLLEAQAVAQPVTAAEVAGDRAASSPRLSPGPPGPQETAVDRRHAAEAAVINAYRRALAIDPGHRFAVSRVTAVLAERGMHAERAQVLEGLLAATPSEYTRIQTHLELGRLYAEMLGDSARARAHFEAVLALAPTHFEAASALRALYKDAREQALHLGVLKVLVEHSPDIQSRLLLLTEMAEIAPDVSREETFSAYRRIFEIDPTIPGVEARLGELAEALGRHAALADAFAAAARKRGGPRAAVLWTAAARLYDQRLPRPQDALYAYRRALELRPDDRGVQEALERLLRQQDDPAALVEVLRAQLSRSTAPDEQALLLAKLGTVLDRELDDLEGAIRTFGRVLDLEPRNAPALANLDDLYRRKEDWAGLVGIIARREALAESPVDLAELQCRRARVLDEKLGQQEAAAELYLDVLASFPENAEVVHALASLLARGVHPERIARALEPVFAQRGQFGRQLDMLAVLLEHAVGPGGEAARRELGRRAAQVAEQRLGDPEAAFDFIAAALAEDPEHEEVRESFLRLAEKAGLEARAADVLAAVLERFQTEDTGGRADSGARGRADSGARGRADSGARGRAEGEARGRAEAQLSAALAEIADAVLDDKARAIEYYRRALRADGGNAVAIAALERLLGAEERWPELASLLEERIARSSETSARVNLGLALAAIRDQHLDDLDRAIEAYREVLAVDPAEGRALAHLADAFERQGRRRELAAVLDRMRDASSDPEVQAATEVKVGDVLRLHLGDRPGALERYRRALARRPDAEGALKGLEALLEAVEVRAEAGAILEPCYERAERWRDLIAALEAQLSAAVDPERRRSLFHRMAEIEREKLAQPEAAFETLARAFRESLVRKEERAMLAEVAFAAHKARALAALYADALSGVLPRRTSSGALGHPAAGDLDAPHPAVDPDLLRELARLYDGEAAEVQAAKATWKRLLDLIPSDAEALEALERIHAAGDNPNALAEVLLARADASSGTARVAFLKRASAIYEDAAEDLPRAIDAMDRARLEQPRDRSTIQELERLYGVAGRHDKVRDMLDTEADLVEEPVQRAAVLIRLAELQLQLGDFAGAVSAYQAALVEVPDHPLARAGLEGLLKSPVGPAAALALEPVYRAAGDWQRLVDAYEVLVQASRDGAERVERLVAIRSIFEERLGKPDRAFQAAVRAYREHPRDEELLAALERLARLSGQVPELLALLEDQAEGLPYVSQERYEVRIRIARFTETLLRDRAQAVDAWKRVLEERPDSLIALEALERLYTRSGEARELVDVLRTMAGLLEDPQDRAPHLRRAGQILDEKLGDRAQAARVYEQVLSAIPGDVEALKRLDAIYTETRAWEELALVLSEEIAVAKEPRERALLHLRLGRLREKALHDLRGALNAYAGVLTGGRADVPDAHDGAIKAIEELIEQVKRSNPELAALAAELVEPHWADAGDHIKVVAAKEVRIAAAQDPARRRALLFEIAEIYEAELEQPELAFLALARAYAENPRDPELADRLERLAVVAEAEEELADLYAQAIPVLEGGYKRSETGAVAAADLDEAIARRAAEEKDSAELALRLARKVAHTYDVVLERGDAAVPFYEIVLANVPDDAASLRALERIHRRAGNALGLVEVYRSMLRLVEDQPAEQKVIWKEIARIMEDDLHDPDGAFEAYRAMMVLDSADVGVVRAMAALSERSRRFEDLAMLLLREAELATRVDDKAQVLLRLASLRREQLDDMPGAVQAYQMVLEARRDDPGAIAGLAAIAKEGGEAKARAAAALAPVYYTSGAFAEYIACLEAQLGFARTPEERNASLLKIADTYEHKLGRPEHAFTYSCRALHEDLTDGEVRARVERLAAENGLYEDLAAFYLDELDAVEDHELGLALRRRVAEIYDDALQDTDRAIGEYTRILDVVLGDAASLEALERLYRKKGAFQALADVFRRRIAQTEDRDARAQLMRELARIQADELKDAPGAIATLRRLLDLVPEDVDALARLARLCADQGRASELSDVLTRLIAAAEDGSPVQLDAMFDLGSLKADRLGDLGGAEALFTEILTRDPAHARTRELLEARLENALAGDDEKVAGRTAELLADALRRAEEWQSLISVLGAQLNLQKNAGARVALRREIAAVYEVKLEQRELAFSTLAQVFREAPALEEVRETLERLAESLDMHEALVDVLEAGLERTLDGELALEIERRVAQLVEQELAHKERAAEAWLRVLGRRPLDPEALEALDRLLTALGRWAALTEILEKRVELAASDPGFQLELLTRLGATWEERLGEREEAVAVYRKARAIAPEDRETLVALSLLLDPAEAAEELFGVLEKLATAAKGNSELLRLLPRMATLAGGRLDRRAEAIELWQRVLQLEPTSVEALKGLDQLLEAEGRWEELARLLEKQVQLARDEKEIVRLQRRLGLIKGTKLGSVDEAVRSWSEILKRNPNDVEAHQALRDTYRQAGRWEELVSTLRRLIPLQVEADGVKQIRFELAEVYLTHLDQREEAIESAKRVLDVEPHTEAELMRLEEIFVATGAFGEAVKVMNARVELSERGSEKIDILFDIATVYETRIGRKAGAAQAYERILQIDRTTAKAYDAVASIYEGNGDYRKLVELLNRRLDVTEGVDERRLLLFKVIDVQERWLGQPELAFTAACRAFAEEGADANAQATAERLANETDNWEILAEVFEEQIEQVGTARAIELRRRLGEIYLSELSDPARAERQLEIVLASQPEDELSRGLLVGMLETQGRWRDLIAQLQDQVEIASTVEEKRELFRRIAEIEERELQDIDAAVASTKRILDLDPENGAALDELVRMFRRAGKWHPLLSVLNRKLELASDGRARVELRFEIADVWETGIEDVDHAVESYRDVLALDPDHLPSLRALEKLFTQQERWTELVEVFERQVAIAKGPGDAIRLLERIAGLREEHFQDLEQAADTLRRILAIDPDHLPTVKALERVYRRGNDWERLIEVYNRHLDITHEPRDKVELYVALGEVLFRELGRIDEAEHSYRRALDVEPRAKAAVRALGQLYEKTGNWYSALEMLQLEAELAGPASGADAEAVEVLYRIGKINEDMLLDKDAAKSAYTRALNLDPSFALAMRSLRHMFFDEGNFEEVIRLQAQEAEYTEDREEAATLYAHAAETALDELEEVERGTRLYELSIEAKADHVPALRALSDLYFGSESWEQAEKLLERLVDKLDRHDDLTELCRHYYHLAYIAEKLGDDTRALRRYLQSYELDSTYLQTLEGLGAALLRAERWEDAQRIFQTILIHHKASLTEAEVVDLHFQLGELAVRLGQNERAKKSFDKALDLDPDHLATLEAYARLAEATAEWEAAYDLRERLIAHLDGDEKFEALLAQAKLCRDRIKEPYRAIDAFSEARRLRPKSVEVLRALVKLFQETSQAQKTIEALEDLARVVEDSTERRDIYFELARILADEVKNIPGAVDALNRALDLDHGFVKGFERIEQLLAQSKSWTALEENYHKMIQRLPKEQKTARIVLWRSLGELYQKVLKNDEGARVAYEVVLKLEPDAHDVGFRLAEIFSKSRETAPKAIELYHKLFPVAEDPAPPAHRLFELYTHLGQLDRGFCALSALLLMRGATADEQKAYALLLKKAPQMAKRSLTDNLWRMVVLDHHCRNSLADIASILYRGAPELFGEAQKTLQLKKKERVDLTDSGKNARARLRYFDVWQRLANAMYVGEMDHYHRPGSTQAPRLYPGAPAVLFVGEQHEAFKEMPPRQIAWVLARQMACARPEIALVKALAPEDAAAALEAAIQLWSPDGSGVDLQIDPKLVADWRKALQRILSERALKALKDPVITCLERRDMRHLARFIEGAEHTASRAALLMAGDVAVAERGLGDSDQLVDVSFRSRVRALMLYTLSDDYFVLREKLGLTIA